MSNLISIFSNKIDAQKVINDLEAAGVEGDNVSLIMIDKEDEDLERGVFEGESSQDNQEENNELYAEDDEQSNPEGLNNPLKMFH